MSFLRIFFVGSISFTAAALVALRYMVSRGSNGIEMIDPNAYLRPLKDEAVKGAASRHFDLKRVRNARDLGGYVTRDGRTVRWGKVFRTGALGAATEEDLIQLGEMGVNLVCDLRSNREVKELPDKVPEGTTYQRFPIHEDDPMREIFPKILFNRAELVEMMAVGYVRMAEDRPEAFGEVLKQMADPNNLPILFHCTAGKDRAGITAALLLALLGVPHETIFADYSLSNYAFEGLYADFEKSSASGLSRFGVPLEDLKGLLVADPDWITNLFNHLETTHGSIEGYLTTKAGLSPELIEQIRENLLEG